MNSSSNASPAGGLKEFLPEMAKHAIDCGECRAHLLAAMLEPLILGETFRRCNHLGHR